MNIVELNNLVRKIALACPLVNSYYNMSPYECWNTKEVKYGSIVMDITNVSTNTAISTYQCLFYYGDRLTESKTNKNAVRTDAISVLDTIISKLYEQDGISINYNQSYTLFEQKFEDELAGAYVTVNIQVVGDGMCGFDIEIGSDFEVTQLHETIKDNGIYEWKPGKDKYYDQVLIDVDVPKAPNFGDIGYTQNDGLVLGDPSRIDSDIIYSKQKYDSWNNGDYGYPNQDQETGIRFWTQDPNLVYCPKIDTSQLDSFWMWFHNAIRLKTIQLLDASNVENILYMFGNFFSQYATSVKYLGGFKDLGKGFKYDYDYNGYQTLILSRNNLTLQSIMNVINNLYDLNLNGKYGQLVLGTTNLNKLTEDEIAIATNKGWTVS